MTADLVLQLAIAAMQHAQELAFLFQKYQGQDVPQAEVDAVRLKASSRIDALQAQNDAAKAAAGAAP
jgi:hypothetical protein